MVLKMHNGILTAPERNAAAVQRSLTELLQKDAPSQASDDHAILPFRKKMPSAKEANLKALEKLCIDKSTRKQNRSIKKILKMHSQE